MTFLRLLIGPASFLYVIKWITRGTSNHTQTHWTNFKIAKRKIYTIDYKRENPVDIIFVFLGYVENTFKNEWYMYVCWRLFIHFLKNICLFIQKNDKNIQSIHILHKGQRKDIIVGNKGKDRVNKLEILFDMITIDG